MHLVDLSPRLVEHARQLNAKLAEPIASLTVADARALAQPDRFAAAVLVMGPLYHLPSETDRQMVLAEAVRVLDASGGLVVAAVSRYVGARWPCAPAGNRTGLREQCAIATCVTDSTEMTAGVRADDALRADILNVARAVESEPSIIRASAHLLAIGRKRWGLEGLRS